MRRYLFITIRQARRVSVAALVVLCALAAGIAMGSARARRAIDVDIGSSGGAGVRLPIIMYHSVVRDGLPRNDYQITVSQLANDLDWLSARGYNTVLIADLVSYALGEAALPARPVMLTFDDGQLNNLAYALPQLKQRGMRGVFSVCGTFIERAERERDPSPLYAYMTWADIREAASTETVEIANHSYNLHGEKNGRRGFTRRAGETKAAFQSSLMEDVSMMQQLLRLNTGVEAACFTYPYGFTYDGSWTLLRDLGFKAAMTCREKVNCLPRDPDALFHLNRFNRSGYTTTEAFMKRLGIE
ncbi:MAG: polysaccharide deacetylase family protein [Oscillospiraceae bacterium]|jgi:peptidoglycan/xylan/chitin deacetylase (PgdA/CDA1 family)|nr:polysaccharide deacetylase family protein [Oscillospiraceae bacterium]